MSEPLQMCGSGFRRRDMLQLRWIGRCGLAMVAELASRGVENH